MKSSLRRFLLSLLFVCCPVLPAFSAEPAAPAPAAPTPQHYLILLHLVPRLHDDKAWTDVDKDAVGAHFQRLKAATAAGQVLLAGRTKEPGDKTLGLVIFTAGSEAAAREFMLADPCVARGVMTAELRPYALALRAK